jgi:hypothetical protein
MMNNLETVGNAQISTSVFKYGTGSLAFDGSGDGLVGQTNPMYQFGTGDFTVEGWLYLTAYPAGSNAAHIVDFRNSGNYYAFRIFNSVLNVANRSGQILNGSQTFPLNSWQHFAFVRSGSTLTAYLNGVNNGSVTNTLDQGLTNIIIGSAFNSSEFLTGYIDDLRITKGYARYTTSFTPPTAAFADN